jgi:glycosyltransferase involved in cell wall biosynthesis
MRILHADAGRQMRGGQWQVLRLMEGLAAAGVETTLLARKGSPLFASARERWLHVEPFGITRAAWLLREHDLMHAHDSRSHTLGALLRAPRLVVSRRVAFSGARFWPASRMSEWKYSRAVMYIAISDFVRKTLVARGVRASKVAVVHDGVPLLELSGQAKGLLQVLAPANEDDPQKGAPLAIEAAALANVPLKLSSHLEADLREATVFVYITYSEGLGSAVLLAMSAGVPVVASRVGGLPEVIRHGENGLLVENTAPEIAAAIRQLLDHPDFARRIGAAARQTIVERFTVERMVQHTMEVYRQVLS